MERLPIRVEGRLSRLLGMQTGDLDVVLAEGASLPGLRCELERPVLADISIVLRVHARSGVPLAHSTISLAQGDKELETKGLTLLAMEGYAHLAPADRQRVHDRVWSRRAYATASVN